MKLKLVLLSVLVVLCGVIVPQFKVSAQELKEQTAHITDEEFRDVLEESMGSIIETRATSRGVNWTVPANRRYCTAYFPVNSGGYILLAMNLSKSAKTGIIDEDGYIRYVTGTSISHTFNITSSKSYCVFVQNLNSTAISATGSYAWN